MIRQLILSIIALLLGACAPEVVQHNNAGNDRFSDALYDEAISEYRQAQLSDPDRVEPYYNAANVYNRQAQLDATLSQAQQALKTASSDLAAQTWYNVGNALFDAEAWPEAVAAYQEALRIDPDDPDAKHNLELALKEMEQQESPSQKDQQDSSPAGGEDSRLDTPTPSPPGKTDASDGSNQATPVPSGEAFAKEDMTEEQALQLIEALVRDAETLQERLHDIYRVPGPLPEQDW